VLILVHLLPAIHMPTFANNMETAIASSNMDVMSLEIDLI